MYCCGCGKGCGYGRSLCWCCSDLNMWGLNVRLYARTNQIFQKVSKKSQKVHSLSLWHCTLYRRSVQHANVRSYHRLSFPGGVPFVPAFLPAKEPVERGYRCPHLHISRELILILFESSITTSAVLGLFSSAHNHFPPRTGDSRLLAGFRVSWT